MTSLFEEILTFFCHIRVGVTTKFHIACMGVCMDLRNSHHRPLGPWKKEGRLMQEGRKLGGRSISLPESISIDHSGASTLHRSAILVPCRLSLINIVLVASDAANLANFFAVRKSTS